MDRRAAATWTIALGLLSVSSPTAKGQIIDAHPAQRLLLGGDSMAFGGRIDAVAEADGLAVFGMGTSLMTADVTTTRTPTIVGRLGGLPVHWNIASIAIGDGVAWVLSDRPDEDLGFGPFASCGEGPPFPFDSERADVLAPLRQLRSYSAPPAVAIDLTQMAYPRLLRSFDLEQGNGFQAITARRRHAVALRSIADGVTVAWLDVDAGTVSTLLTMPTSWHGDVQWLDDGHLVLVGGAPVYEGATWSANLRLRVLRVDADPSPVATVIADIPMSDTAQVVDVATTAALAFALLRDTEPVLLSFDLSDPAAPRRVDNLSIPAAGDMAPHCARSLALAPDGRTLYFSDDRHGVRAVHVDGAGRLTTTPFDVSTGIDGSVSGITVVGSRLAVATGTALAVADAVRATVPQVIGAWRTLVAPQWVALRGDHAYVIGSDMGLDVVDLADGLPVRVRGRLRLPSLTVEASDPVGIAMGIDGVAWVMAGGSLFGIDVGDADAPRIVSRYAPSEPLRALAVDGTRVAITGGACVELLDGVDPADPTRIGEVALPLPDDPSREHCPDSLALSGDRLYLGGEALRIVDIGVPDRPRALDGLAHPVRDIEFLGGLVVTGTDGHDDRVAMTTVFDVREDHWRPHLTYRCGWNCPQVALAPMGPWIAVVTRDDFIGGLTARLLDASTLADTGLRWRTYTDEPGDLAIDGAHLLTTSDYTDLLAHRLWPVEIALRAYLPQLWTGPRAYRP